LVLVPTRELAYQVSKMYQQLVTGSRDQIRLLTGGQSTTSSLEKKLTTLTIATPGRLVEILSLNPDLLKRIQLLVLDEYDKLLALGFEDQLETILKHVRPSIQRLGFSATKPESEFGQSLFHIESTYILNEAQEKPQSSESLFYLKTSKTKNKLCLEALANKTGQVIIFVKNTAKANHLNGYLKLNGYHCEALHGKLLQKTRSSIYQKFMDKKFDVLVATDLVSRGLDTVKVNTVINFDLPINADIYTHRIGRAGRLKQKNTILNFASPEDFIPLKKIEKGLGRVLIADNRYNQRETWLKSSRYKHQQKIQREQRLKEIKIKQGLEEGP